MAFVKAETVRYENIYDPTTGVMTAIFMGGLIYDDAWVQKDAAGTTLLDETGAPILAPKYAECWITGDELAGLPAEDPATAPFDARGQAIRAIAAREAKAAWIRFNEAEQLKPVLTWKTPDELAILPPMTPEEIAAAPDPTPA